MNKEGKVIVGPIEPTKETGTIWIDTNSSENNGVIKSIKDGEYSSISSTSDVRKYKSYVAILSFTMGQAPIATELENSIGEIIWSKSSNGVYLGTIYREAFVSGKTVLFSNQPNSDSIVAFGVQGGANVYIRNAYCNSGSFELEDLAGSLSVQIMVYE